MQALFPVSAQLSAVCEVPGAGTGPFSATRTPVLCATPSQMNRAVILRRCPLSSPEVAIPVAAATGRSHGAGGRDRGRGRLADRDRAPRNRAPENQAPGWLCAAYDEHPGAGIGNHSTDRSRWSILHASRDEPGHVAVAARRVIRGRCVRIRGRATLPRGGDMTGLMSSYAAAAGEAWCRLVCRAAGYSSWSMSGSGSSPLGQTIVREGTRRPGRAPAGPCSNVAAKFPLRWRLSKRLRRVSPRRPCPAVPSAVAFPQGRGAHWFSSHQSGLRRLRRRGCPAGLEPAHPCGGALRAERRQFARGWARGAWS